MPLRPIALALAVLFCWSAPGAAAESDKPTRILFVGNSYTAGTRWAIEFFLERSGREHELRFVTPGGKRLADHADNEKTQQVIAEGNWDLVVLQGQSQTPALPPLQERFLRGGERLDRANRAAGAGTLLFLTWGRRDGDKQNLQVNPDFETMQARLNEAYARLGEKTEARIAPIGKAWADLHRQSPQLWRRLYKADGSHPSRQGAYLSGAVFYAAITGEDPTAIRDAPSGISKEEAALLRNVAARIVDQPAAR